MGSGGGREPRGYCRACSPRPSPGAGALRDPADRSSTLMSVEFGVGDAEGRRVHEGLTIGIRACRCERCCRRPWSGSTGWSCCSRSRAARCRPWRRCSCPRRRCRRRPSRCRPALQAPPSQPSSCVWGPALSRAGERTDERRRGARRERQLDVERGGRPGVVERRAVAGQEVEALSGDRHLTVDAAGRRRRSSTCSSTCRRCRCRRRRPGRCSAGTPRGTSSGGRPSEFRCTRFGLAALPASPVWRLNVPLRVGVLVLG